MGQSLGFKRHLLGQQGRHQFHRSNFLNTHQRYKTIRKNKQTNNNNKTNENCPAAAGKKKEKKKKKKKKIGTGEIEKQCSLLPRHVYNSLSELKIEACCTSITSFSCRVNVYRLTGRLQERETVSVELQSLSSVHE